MMMSPGCVTSRTFSSPSIIALCLLCAAWLAVPAQSVFLPGTDRSFARYPRWNACVNATFSFEFKTTQSGDSLLMYVDDGGTFDFVEVTIHNGRVKLVLNIVDGRDGHVNITMGNNVNDGRWHRVDILRNRMETTLIVDGLTGSRFAFGSDFLFGNVSSNSHVFFGGLPESLTHTENLYSLALPSVLTEPRFRGHIRNVLYGNCTCQTQRATLINGEGADNTSPEVCETRNPCRDGCLCISNDTAPACDCSELQCVTGIVSHYTLPMDVISLNTIINPSGLDAKVFGTAVKVPGIVNSAIRVDGQNNYIQVSGPSHRYECFGDLDKCQLGYTMAFWVNFEQPCDSETVYLSNGGHNPNSHGVAMLYDRGSLQFRFRNKNGQEWRVKYDNILPKRWYHVTASWSATDGLSLYVDGNLVHSNISPIVVSSLGSRGRGLPAGAMAQSFIIGRPNEGGPVRESCAISLDEFNFWSMLKSPDEVKELGPMYCYDMSMNSIRNNRLIAPDMSAMVHGNPTQVEGKVGQAINMDGRRDYIDGGDQTNTCLGAVENCVYGITIATWIKFTELRNNMYFISTGKQGINLFYKNNKVVGELQKENDYWKVEWGGAETGRWYYIELTWKPTNGLRMYVDLEQVSSSNIKIAREVPEGSRQLYLGRANSMMQNELYANALFDEVELCYGDRERLEQFDFIIRGRPTSYYFNMDGMSNGVLTHPSIDIDLYGQPNLVAGKVRAGINFDGNSQYAAFKDQGRVCMGNIDLCRHGLLLGAWIKPGKLGENMEFFTTGANGIRAWYEGGRLKVAARTSTREWMVETSQFKANEWQFLEISWDPEKGIGIYKNNQLVSFNSNSNVRSRDPVDGYWSELELDIIQFYLGRGEGLKHNAKYANITFDEMEFWYGNRDYLIAFGYIQRGRPTRYFFTMDDIRNGRLVHPTMTIPAHGRPSIVPGKIYNAVRFNGNNQYLDLGQHVSNCFGNISMCNHGYTGSMWTNFKRFRNNMYYYSNGNGIKLHYKNNLLMFDVETPGKLWSVPVSNLETNKWYFLEYSWHPEKGLQVYVNNVLAGETAQPRTIIRRSPQPNNHVYIARANDNEGRFTHADAVIDEVETWFGDRDYLIAFGHILRDDVPHDSIAMETQRGNTIYHPNFDINLYGGATVVPGKIGNAVRFNGNRQYLSLGNQQNVCLGNLEKCEHGLTVSFLMNPQRFIEKGYFLSSGPYSVYYENGKVHTKFSTPTETWQVSTNHVNTNKWQKIDLSWDKERGLQMYVDQALVAENTQSVPNTDSPVSDHNIYLGRPNLNTNGFYSDVMIDELDYWYSYRDHLAAFGLLDEDVSHVEFKMDSISNGVMNHPRYTVSAHGGARTVQSTYGNTVLLNGVNQYLDFGNGIICGGDLQQCSKGFTTRFKMKPNSLRNNTYFMSSAPFDLYYRNGQLVAEVRTANNLWRTSTAGMQPNAWNQVDVSWHPTDGLQMYMDSNLVASQPQPIGRPALYDPDARFFIGRANTNMKREKFPDAMFHDLQLWEAKRNYLVGKNLITNEFTPGIQTTPGPGGPDSTPFPPHGPQTGGDQDIIFNGRQWIAYDTRELPEDYFSPSNFEDFHIRFKTEDPTGMLWWSGDEEKNMHISLKDGTKLIFFIDYGTGQTDRVRVESTIFGNLDDNEWHDVYIKRRGNTTVVKVDDLELPPLSMRGVASLLSRGAIYLAGGPNPQQMTNNIVRKNLYATINRAVLTNRNAVSDLDLVDLYLNQPRPDYVYINGDIDLTSGSGPQTPRPTPGVSTPAPLPETTPPSGTGVSFTEKGAYLITPRLDFAVSGTIEFDFLTKEPHGLMMYSGGQPGTRYFVALEMYDGDLYFVIDFGDKPHRFKFGNPGKSNLNDGRPHHVKVNRNGANLELTLDDVTVNRQIRSRNHQLKIGTFNYLGGVDIPERLPWYLWSFGYKDFVGCMWSMKFNNVEQDLQALMATQFQPGLEEGCPATNLACASRPCLSGMCLDKWDGFYCDCAETNKTGRLCENRAPIVSFDGSDFVRVDIHPPMNTHTNDISLRFKTHKPSSVLFSTSNNQANDFIRFSLENGRGRMETNLGGQDYIEFFCDNLNDNEWHTLHVQRRAGHLKYWVDDCNPRTTNLLGEGFTLDVDQVLVASLGRNADPDFDFVGHMQNFYFDDHKIFEYLGGTNVPPEVKIDQSGGDFGYHEKEIKYYPITFRTGTDSYVYVPPLRPDGNMKFKFMFKTTDDDGLLFYNGGEYGDFLMGELVNGYMHFGMNDGDNAQVFKVSDNRLNDDEWHSVNIEQHGRRIFRVQIDDSPPVSVNRPQSVHTLDLTDNLYVGSVTNRMYDTLHSLINSRKGFGGCLATLKVDGKLYVLPDEAMSSSQLVVQGCTTAVGFCNLDTCKHFGVCKEALNNYICDCNMTAHVGDICDGEPEGYRIGQDKRQGIAVFTFDHPEDTEIDKLAFGFMTWEPNGTMVRAESGFASDYITAKLENGHVIVTYDIGNGPQTIVEDRRKFNDGQYHYVTFVRRRNDATLRVDDYPAKEISPGGTGTVFNELKYLTVGGELVDEEQIRNYFDGILAGVYINGYRVIDLGQDGNSQMIVRGDVRNAVHKFNIPRPILPTPAPTSIPDNGGGATPIPGSGPPGPDSGSPAPPVIPPDNGGGVVWEETDTGIIIETDPGGGGVGVETGVGQPGSGGVAKAQIGAGGVGGQGGEGARAGAVAGAFIGLLMLASGMGWALYKFKPGLIGGGGGGGGAPPAVSSPMNISSPRATNNYALVEQNAAAGIGSGYGRGGGAGGGGGGGASITVASANGASATGIGITSSHVSTQTPAGMGPSGAAAANFQALTGGAAAGSGIAGVSAGRGTVTRPTQTDLFFVSGPPPAQIAMASNGSAFTAGSASGSAAAMSSSSAYGQGGAGSAYGSGGAGFSSSSYSEQVTTTNITGLEQFDSMDASATSARGGAGYGSGYGTGYGTGYSSVKTVASTETQTPDVSPLPAPSPQQQYAMYDAQGQAMSSSYQGQAHGQGQTMSSSYQGQTHGQGQAMSSSSQSQAQAQGQAMNGYQSAGYANGMGTNNMFSSSYKEMSSYTSESSGGHSQSTAARARTLSPPPDATLASSYQMRNMALLNSAGVRTSQNPNIFLAAEEIRVDCIELSEDGRYVITGSIFGPPQVWDMRTGELVRVMAGEDLSSTDLHLAAGDSLLVGQVAEMTQVDPNDDSAAGRVHNRKLQLWDFSTGRPLEMSHNELCTASCMMKDGEKVVLGRTDKFGGGTNIVIWDLLGNEPVRKLKLDASIGFADHISYLNLSKDSRYVVAGFQNSYDHNANFIIFDLTVDDYTNVDPVMLALDAEAEVTAILDNHEAVTGTRKGELTIWSLRTGKALRQFVSPSSGVHTLSRTGAMTTPAHTDEIKAIEISGDGQYLVSASADTTLKVWSLETEKHHFTLRGHTDEVWCCAISPDNDIIASGSRDGSIRLWRMQNGVQICNFYTGVDIFTVKMSKRKKTVVALGDKYGARKLIMLQVVHSKTKSRGSSRTTSPMHFADHPQNY